MIDLTFLEKFTKGDPNKMKRYISLYLEVAPKTFEEMKRNLESKDWEQIRIKAHSLKPQVDFMGIIELKKLLIEIEEAVKVNKHDYIELLLNSAYEMHIKSESILGEMLKQNS